MRGGGSLGRLPGLALYVLAGVADALALVGLGLADLADVGGDLANSLLVDAPHEDAVGRRNLEADVLGRVDDDGVAVPDGQLDLVAALRRRPIADAHDLELF